MAAVREKDQTPFQTFFSLSLGRRTTKMGGHRIITRRKRKAIGNLLIYDGDPISILL